MLNFHRIGLVAALAALVVLPDSQSAFAQRRGNLNFGGGSNNNNNNANNNNNNNQDGNRRKRNRDEDDKKSNVQTFQNLIQGGQGNQGGSGNQQFRRSNQPGSQGLQQTFQNSQQLQQLIQSGQVGQGQNWQTQKFNRRNELQKWVVGFHGGPQPFSDDWFENHPQAWHIQSNNNVQNNKSNKDAWKIATAAGIFAWLGWQANHPYHHNTVYVYDPVPVQTVVVGGQPSVVLDPAAPGEWMTLGAYTLMTGAGDPGTRILQLAIDREGNIRGSYYDMITNRTNNVIGLIDKNTQQVRWTLDTNQQLTFVATLDQLTQSQGVVNVKFPGGQIQQWQLVRMENAPVSN